MTYEIVKEQNKQPRDKVEEVFSVQSIKDPVKAIARHEQFLALLKKHYGYTNEKAVDELERLLKLFYTMNKSLGIHQAQTNIKDPQISALKKGERDFNLQIRASRKGESNEKRSRFVD